MDINAKEYQYKDINVISKRQFAEHKKLYAGYVAKTNEITKALYNSDREQANGVYSQYRGLKESESFALDGVIIHEYYFENIGSKNSVIPAEAKKAITETYGDFDKWKEDFIACAKVSRGWVIFSYEKRTKTYRNISLDAHNVGLVALSDPLVVLDMYEHAYFLDYGTDKVSYINKFIDNICWDTVLDRMNNISK